SVKYEKATTINPDYAKVFNNWGNTLCSLAMIEKDTNPEKVIKYLEEAHAKYEKATTINPDYAKAFYNWGTSLNDLAMIEKDTDPKKAIKYLDEAIETVKKAFKVSQDSQAKTFIEIFLGILRREKEALELNMFRNATRTAL
ncbi:MAG: hypothetical protein KKB21_01595, partial [Nanoarchaeota archaeon]|nr:hypothetical protein [Nanoarchaeota archaeon]